MLEAPGRGELSAQGWGNSSVGIRAQISTRGCHRAGNKATWLGQARANWWQKGVSFWDSKEYPATAGRECEAPKTFPGSQTHQDVETGAGEPVVRSVALGRHLRLWDQGGEEVGLWLQVGWAQSSSPSIKSATLST